MDHDDASALPRDARGFIHRATALKWGHTDRELKALLRSGTLQSVLRGVYITAAQVSGPADLYRLRCLASGGTADPDGDDRLLSHDSAAAILRLALLKPDRHRIHTTAKRGSHGKKRAHRHVHTGPLDGHTTAVDGVAVTNAARTAVDVAHRGTFAQALTAFDSALRMGVPRDELEAVLTARRLVGIATARAALAHADGSSANPGESWSRAQIIEAGLPIPGLQVSYVLSTGSRAIVDFDWEGKVVGEFDGRAKYREHQRAGEGEGDVVFREKRREEELRDLGLTVVRWTWADLEQRTAVPRIARALARAGLYPTPAPLPG